MSFRTRLTISTAAAVAVAVALASVATYFVVRKQLRDQVDDALVELADEAVTTSPEGRLGVEIDNEPFGRPGYAQLIGPDAPIGSGNAIRPTRRALAVAFGTQDSYFADVSAGGIRVRVLTQRLPVFGDVALQVARPLTEVDSVLGRLRWILLVVTAAGVALAAGIGRVVATAALGPVKRLSEATEHVARTEDLSHRIEAPGHDELSRLAASFNVMMDSLQESLSLQRRLVADASHELRTPITSVRTNIELLQRPGALPSEEREKLMDDVVTQLSELTALIGDIVELARGGAPPAEMQEVRLDELVGSALERSRRHHSGVVFDFSSEPCVVHGVPERIERAVGNLLDNAAKWSPEVGTVDVSVGDGVVEVRDHGPGVSEQDAPFVFDRFYRAAAARGLPGSGLGLAIVKQVAESHGGSVTVNAAPGAGALFRLTFPRRRGP